ncbi:MAG: PQQ-binding-like beta-propeller repeat protein [Chloroflexota bacterium]
MTLVARAAIGMLVLLAAGCVPEAAQGGKQGARPSGSHNHRHQSAASDQSTPARHLLQHLWTRSIAPNADSVPVYAAHVRFPHGKTRPVLFVLAGNNTADCSPSDPVSQATLYAFNPASGKVYWKRSTRGPARCTTSSPVVDSSGRCVYVPGLDGKVHRYQAYNGKESKVPGWPHTVTLMPDVEKVSAALTLGRGYLYVTTSGFIGDQGHYEGHLVSINLKNGHSHVFNTLCSNIHRLLGPGPGSRNYCPYVTSGLFGRGEGEVGQNGDVWIVSGNGAWNGHTNWGDSVLKMNPAGNRLLDSYTPVDQAYLANNDLDLGSTAPAFLPPLKVNGHVYRLVVQAGKGPSCDGCSGVAVRLLNADNLSEGGGPGHLGGDLRDANSPGGCEVLTAPAVWKSPGDVVWVFYANDCGFTGYRLTHHGAHFGLSAAWQLGRSGTGPVVSGGKLFLAYSGGLRVYRLSDHRVLASASLGQVHWQYPAIGGHRLFVSDQAGHITSFWAG